MRGLRCYLKQVRSNHSNILVSNLLKSVENRLHTYERNKGYQVAAILDPIFRLDWCKNEEERVAMHSKLTTQACAMTEVLPPPPVVSESGSASPAQKRKKSCSVSWIHLPFPQSHAMGDRHE